VRALKRRISSGKPVTILNADRKTLAVDGDVGTPLEGSSRLFAAMLESFDLTAVAEDFGRHTKLWGPDLVTPSSHTVISPWVLGGEPCVERTRIPSAAIYSPRTERGLASADIVNLFPGLDQNSADDAYELESRLRGTSEPQAA
jgi:uncharacterized protein (DUF433 family)